MRGPGCGAARGGPGGAYLVRWARRYSTRSSKAPARARPGALRSCSSDGSSGKRPMPADEPSAVRSARGCGVQPGVSFRAACAATLPPGAVSRSCAPSVRPARLDCSRRCQERHRRPPRLGLKVPGLPPPPAHTPPTRTAPRGDRLAPPGGSWKMGREGGPKRGKGLGFPESERLRPGGGGFLF